MMNSGSLDYWRKYFRGVSIDIFDIIDRAIMVAASDRPKDFMLRRCDIAERLFSYRLNRCSACGIDELATSVDNEDVGGGCTCKSELEAAASKESKVNNSCKNCDHHGDHDLGEMKINHVSKYTYGEAEALTDAIEQESQSVEEILRIKEILVNYKEQSDSMLFDSLKRLQLMNLTIDHLQSTEIGKATNPLRKHGSKNVSQLARALVADWKKVADEWIKSTKPTAGSESTLDSVNPSDVDYEDGLPSPPMDEGALFAPQTGSMELSQFFDCMDDDGNIIKNREDGRRPLLLNNPNIAKRKSEASSNEAAARQNKPVTANVGHGRPPRPTMQKKSNIEPTMPQSILKDAIPKRPQVGQPNKLKCPDDVGVQLKLEATTRKLQERYQQAENAKRQRTVQVVELHDLPNQGSGRNPVMKPRYHKRQWSQGRI